MLILPSQIQQALQEAAEKRTRLTNQQIQRKEILSKIQGNNGYLESLLQKRYRIDQEIKKTERRLKKLKKLTQKSQLNESLSESGLIRPDLARNIPFYVELEETIQELTKSLDSTETLLSEVSTLELKY